MNAAERRRLLGDDVIADIHRQVEKAPNPTDDVIAALRRIFTRPAQPAVKAPEAPPRAA